MLLIISAKTKESYNLPDFPHGRERAFRPSLVFYCGRVWVRFVILMLLGLSVFSSVFEGCFPKAKGFLGAFLILVLNLFSVMSHYSRRIFKSCRAGVFWFGYFPESKLGVTKFLRYS